MAAGGRDCDQCITINYPMTREAILDALLREFLTESWTASYEPMLRSAVSKRHLLRTLMNLRPPLPVPPDLVELQDRLLSEEREAKGITAPYQLPTIREVFGEGDVPFSDRLVLWKGDITSLAADAIVNAANSKLLGCFVPHHRCIDNAIHSAAGIQLRFECHELMQKQGHDEPTGQAKITRGYNLPSRHVLHSVGPIIDDSVTNEHECLLASCYKACLGAAANHQDVNTVAFCCISTGEFRFPKGLAAQIATQTICEWLAGSAKRLERIIFNVFTQEDYDVYASIFRSH
jgi:O-acetyl-ADP-ribose deacetylase (regulator of RNase III)